MRVVAPKQCLMLDPVPLEVDVLPVVQDPKRAPKRHVFNLFPSDDETGNWLIVYYNISRPGLYLRRDAICAGESEKLFACIDSFTR